jgi:hypothetical protein
MSTLESPSGTSRSMPGDLGYEVTLEMRPSLARLTLIGALNYSAADAIAGIVSCTGEVPCRIEIIADRVTSVDPDGLESLVAAARERVQHGMPAVVITSLSQVVGDGLRRLGMTTHPPVSLAELAETRPAQQVAPDRRWTAERPLVTIRTQEEQ